MVKKKPQPHFAITSIPDTSDYDFFPHLKSNGISEHSKTISSLKDGTYIPFMAAMEYDGKYDKKLKTFTASLKNQDIVASPQDVSFSASLETDRLDQLEKMYTENITPIRRRYYANPRQYYDHILLADGYTNSFGGTVIDYWTDFNIPREIKPVLKLRQPSRDINENPKIIKKHQDIIEKLTDLDMWYSDMGPKANDPHFDISIQQKLKASFKLREVFGRAAIIKENWKDLPVVTIHGEEYKGLANTLKILHPIEMGITEIELYSGKIAGMWVNNDQPYIPMKNMIYMVNEYASPMIGSMSYGFSRMQRSIDQIRLYRRLLAKNFPQYLRVSASGMGAFLINTTGYTDDTRNKIRTALKNSYNASELAVIDYANVQDFEYKEFKINTDIAALVQLHDTMMKTISNVIGVPQSIAYDDSAPARATLVGRLVTFTNFQVSQARTTFGQQLASQWYMPNFREIYKNDKDILEKFYIDVEFENVSLETKQERVDRLLQETELNPYTDEYLGEQMEDKDYTNHIDQKKLKEKQNMAQQNPQGAADAKKKRTGETFSIRDHSSGETSKVTSK